MAGLSKYRTAELAFLALAVLGACLPAGKGAPAVDPHSYSIVTDAAGAMREAGDSSLITWTAGPPLEQARDHHAVFSAVTPAGDFLFVAGGTDYSTQFADTWRLRITADGPAGDWERARALPVPLAGHSVAVAPGLVILTGGHRDGRRVADVITARLLADGTLGEWQPGPPLPRPAFHHAAIYHDGWVYVVGGQGESVSEASVIAARVSDDGSLGTWVEVTPLPRPRSHHASFVHAGEIYVIGGLDGNPALGSALYVDVWKAPILEDGRLDAWRRVSLLPQAYATHSAFVHEDHMYVLGGVENDQTFTDLIWRTPVAVAGLTDQWEAVASPLPAARAHVHNTPVHHNMIYSVGGSHSRRMTARLYVGRIRTAQ